MFQQAESGIDFGVTRIGVNTGTAIIGNFGGEDRFDYTAHGDAINTAARLESVNKHIGTRICISETTVDSCPDLDFWPVGKLVLKGKTKILEVFEPARDVEIDTKAYRDAYDSLETGDALEKFKEMHRRFPEDPLIRFHYERLCSGESGSIMVMQSK